MAQRKRITFMYTGLEIATLFGRFFLDTEDLHYGYWTDGLAPNPSNLKKAQENYSNLIIENIPQGVNTILDVGAGNGNLSRKLQDKGFQVDALTPSPYQAEVITSKLQKGSNVHLSKYQSCKTLGKYDLIIFSESFQYIPLKKVLPTSKSVLNGSGLILICDFFSKTTKDLDIFGGGHSWKKYSDLLTEKSVTILKDIDITKETAPNIELFSELINGVGIPAGGLIQEYMAYKYPRLMSFIKWKFQSKVRYMVGKYDKANLNTEKYLSCKTYRLMLLKP